MNDAKRLLDDAEDFLLRLSKTDPEILVWIRELLAIRDRVPNYEAAVDALGRLISAVDGASHELWEEWSETKGAVRGEGVMVGDLEPDLTVARTALRRLRHVHEWQFEDRPFCVGCQHFIDELRA